MFDEHCKDCEMNCGRNIRYCEDCDDFDPDNDTECGIGCNDCGDCDEL